MSIQQGDFVEARGRQWLVEAVDDTDPELRTVRLSSIADDAQGEQIEVLWDAEIGTSVLPVNSWENVGRGAPDDPQVLAAHLRAIRWKSATAADRDLLQAPSRAPHFIDGTIAIVPEGLRRWPTIAHGRIACGIESRTMFAARSSIWRWRVLSCLHGNWPCGLPTSRSILSRRLRSIGC
jgi:hypothetical protein